MGTGIAKKIVSSLLDVGEPYFYLLNRGLVISAADVHYDNNSGIIHNFYIQNKSTAVLNNTVDLF